MDINQIEYKRFKELNLEGRYITLNDIEKVLKTMPDAVKQDVIGCSIEQRPIYGLGIGVGSIKIMMWSQMHGNESTTTKAVFDLVNLLLHNETLLNSFSFLIIPMLNPDGAERYTRLNAVEVDLNRDAQVRSQPESKVLFETYESYKPHYCLNLHDQRTIFAAGFKGKPASMSFLAPAQDELRSLSNNRRMAMELIAGMYMDLQSDLKDGIGLYDDAFNLNCTGDTFQSFGVPTILFEAGHYPGDYDRERVRECVFKALVSLLNQIKTGERGSVDLYGKIPLNEKSYFDYIIRNVSVQGSVLDLAVQFEERLIEGILHFIPKIEKIECLDDFIGHVELDAGGEEVYDSENLPLQIGNEIDFVMLKGEKLLIKP